MKLSIATLLSFACCFISHAQSTIQVKEETRPMSLGPNNAFVVEVPEIKTDHIQKEWTKYIRKKTKSKAVAGKTEWNLANAQIESILADTISAYANFSQTANGALVAAFFSQKSSFVSSANMPQIAENVKGLMFDFGKTAYLNSVYKTLDNEKRKSDQLKNDKERLFKNEDRNLREIEENNQKIETSESELNTLKEELEIKQKDIFTEKQKALTLSKKSIERQEQNEIVRGMEKDKDKHVKRQQFLANQIANLNANVRSRERNVANLKLEQEKKTKEIKKQDELVASIESKIEAIKKMKQGE